MSVEELLYKSIVSYVYFRSTIYSSSYSRGAYTYVDYIASYNTFAVFYSEGGNINVVETLVVVLIVGLTTNSVV